MRKTVNPMVAIAIVVIALCIAGFWFWRRAQSRRDQVVAARGGASIKDGRLVKPPADRGQGRRGGQAGQEATPGRTP